MSMFEKYDNIDPNYIPDNTSPRPTYDTEELTKEPRIAYNIKGNPIGYSWTYGSEFKLKFSANQTFKVPFNSIVYDTANEKPDETTQGVTGQQAFNTVDCKSWTCFNSADNKYNWVEDMTVYTTDSGKTITFTPDMNGKTFEVVIYNFRWEPIYTLAVKDAADVYLNVDKDIKDIFKPGAYFSVSKITSDTECVMHDKTMLIVV